MTRARNPLVAGSLSLRARARSLRPREGAASETSCPAPAHLSADGFRLRSSARRGKGRSFLLSLDRPWRLSTGNWSARWTVADKASRRLP